MVSDREARACPQPPQTMEGTRPACMTRRAGGGGRPSTLRPRFLTVSRFCPFLRPCPGSNHWPTWFQASGSLSSEGWRPRKALTSPGEGEGTGHSRHVFVALFLRWVLDHRLVWGPEAQWAGRLARAFSAKGAGCAKSLPSATSAAVGVVTWADSDRKGQLLDSIAKRIPSVLY